MSAMTRNRWMPVAVAIIAATPTSAQTARDLLTEAAFEARGRDAALAMVDRARAQALAAAQRTPGDQDAVVLAAVAQGYRAKLTGNRSEAAIARKQMEAATARFPRNAEAQIGLGAWHLGVINRVGGMIGRLVGARRSTGVESLRRSVTLGGDRAMFAGLAGMMLLQQDAGDRQGRGWIEAAARAPTPTPLDRTVRRGAQQIVAALSRNDAREAQALADRLLPFGWYRPG